VVAGSGLDEHVESAHVSSVHSLPSSQLHGSVHAPAMHVPVEHDVPSGTCVWMHAPLV
jgi:hypothetical protein